MPTNNIKPDPPLPNDPPGFIPDPPGFVPDDAPAGPQPSWAQQAAQQELGAKGVSISPAGLQPTFESPTAPGTIRSLPPMMQSALAPRGGTWKPFATAPGEAEGMLSAPQGPSSSYPGDALRQVMSSPEVQAASYGLSGINTGVQQAETRLLPALEEAIQSKKFPSLEIPKKLNLPLGMKLRLPDWITGVPAEAAATPAPPTAEPPTFGPPTEDQLRTQIATSQAHAAQAREAKGLPPIGASKGASKAAAAPKPSMIPPVTAPFPAQAGVSTAPAGLGGIGPITPAPTPTETPLSRFGGLSGVPTTTTGGGPLAAEPRPPIPKPGIPAIPGISTAPGAIPGSMPEIIPTEAPAPPGPITTTGGRLIPPAAPAPPPGPPAIPGISTAPGAMPALPQRQVPITPAGTSANVPGAPAVINLPPEYTTLPKPGSVPQPILVVQAPPTEGGAGTGSAGAGAATRAEAAQPGPGQTSTQAATKPRLKMPSAAFKQQQPLGTITPSATTTTASNAAMEKALRGEQLSTEEWLTVGNRLVEDYGPKEAQRIMGKFTASEKHIGGAKKK